MKRIWFAFLIVLLVPVSVASGDLTYKTDLVPVLVKGAEGILKTYDAETGRFGSGIWICRDQDVLYPLAAAYAIKSDKNPYYKDRDLLEKIMKGGDALIEDADKDGKWMFRKKDGSTWGMIWMPWTYSRWIRAYDLIKDDMPDDRREKWERALLLGYGGIRDHCLVGTNNIATHHAMGLYLAGKTLDQPEWCRAASDFLMNVVGAQWEGGYWSENAGPVVGYNFVYIDALGTYYAVSGDNRVLPALKKGAEYHFHFTYPDGRRVETIDERTPYHPGIDTGNVGFTFTPEGRAYLKRQWELSGRDNLPADLVASLLLYGEEGPVSEFSPNGKGNLFILKVKGRESAATLRKGPWFICLSAFTAPLKKSRWYQDRQNLVSVYHDKTGLLLGGGNTKLQPAWSNFTVGDTSLLRYEPGDTNPNFEPKGALYHIPSAATLVHESELGLDLVYGKEMCRIRIEIPDGSHLRYMVSSTTSSGLPVESHLTVLPRMGTQLTTAGGGKAILGEETLDWGPEVVGGELIYGGCRFRLPEVSTIHWPALPHNPYRKDGHATAEEGRIEIRVPLEPSRPSRHIDIEVLDNGSG